MILNVDNEQLADFVSRVMAEKHLSTYEVARRSGGEISQSTVNKILNRDIRSHSVETLSALAKGLGVPEEAMFRVARGLTPESPTERFEIYAERFDAGDLTSSDWQILENYFEQQIRQWQSLKSAAGACVK